MAFQGTCYVEEEKIPKETPPADQLPPRSKLNQRYRTYLNELSRYLVPEIVICIKLATFTTYTISKSTTVLLDR